MTSFIHFPWVKREYRNHRNEFNQLRFNEEFFLLSSSTSWFISTPYYPYTIYSMDKYTSIQIRCDFEELDFKFWMRKERRRRRRTTMMVDDNVNLLLDNFLWIPPSRLFTDFFQHYIILHVVVGSGKYDNMTKERIFVIWQTMTGNTSRAMSWNEENNVLPLFLSESRHFSLILTLRSGTNVEGVL